MKKALILLLMFFSSAGPLTAQKIAIKTNLLYDALLTVNAGAEFRVAPQWSVDLSGNINAWSLDHGKKWKHWLVQPEVRYWLCDAFAGHFLGAHALAGQYNVGHIDLGGFRLFGTGFKGLRDHRYQGWYGGLGIAYGYAWILTKHLNLEAELGFGWIYTKYDTFECVGCGRKTAEGRKHHYVGPTKAAINLVYVF